MGNLNEEKLVELWPLNRGRPKTEWEGKLGASRKTQPFLEVLLQMGSTYMLVECQWEGDSVSDKGLRRDTLAAGDPGRR